MLYQTFELLKRFQRESELLLEPPPDRTAATWADTERILPPGSPEPGPWRSSRTPFMVPFLEACSSPKYSTIVFVCGAQMGKTENILNVAGHRITDGPFVPILFVFPTEKLSRSMSNDRFKKMIESTDILYSRLEKGHADKVMEKFFSGIRCGFAYAGSATELSSHPAGLVLIDEIDRMSDVSGEGDPYLLAKARTKNYAGAKVVVTSTPTVERASRIWSLWESGTMGRWAWPCIHCKKFFVPESTLLKWDKDCTPEQALLTAKVFCPHCGGAHEAKHQSRLNRTGRYEYCKKLSEGGYENIGPDPAFSPTASFWVSGLASPWQTFGEIAYVIATAERTKNQGTIQGAVNTYYGECYRLRGDAPKWDRVKSHIIDYSCEQVPPAIQIITMGVDVQKNRLYYVIRGYGYLAESWLLEFGEVFGETEFDAVWIELRKIVEKLFSHIPILRVFVDSGYRPGKDKFVRPDNKIYIFCRLNMGQCYPTKGKDTQDKPVRTSKIDLTVSGKTIKGGVTLWHIDTDYFKRQIYSEIRVDDNKWHVSKAINDDYCKQITSEECVTDAVGKRTWIKTREDNHYLDCEVLADAAAYSAGVHNLVDIQPDPREIAAAKEEIAGSFVPVQSRSFFKR